MIEPISAACVAVLAQVTGAVTIGSVAGGIAGNRADALFTRLIGGSVERFIKSIRLPANHDLHKGIVAAQRGALDHLAGTMSRQSRDARDGVIARSVADLIAGMDDAALAAQAEQLSGSLPALVDRSNFADHQAMTQLAADELAEWIEQNIGTPLPDHFRALLLNPAPDGRQSWLDVLRVLIAEQIKEEPRFGQIFLAENTSEILGRTVRIEVLVDALQNGLAGLREDVSAIGEDVRGIATEQQAMAAQVRELLAIAHSSGAYRQAQEAGISEAAVRRIVEQLGGEGIVKGDLVGYLESWIPAARAALARNSNEGEAFEQATAEASRLFQEGKGAAAADPLMELLAQEEAEEARRQEEAIRRQIAILDKAALFDILALEYTGFQAKLDRIARLEGGDNPVHRSMSLYERAEDLSRLGADDPVFKRAAVEAYEAAAGQLAPDSPPVIAPLLRSSQGYLLYQLAVRSSSNVLLIRAIDALEFAADNLSRETDRTSWLMAAGNLAVALDELAMRTQSPDIVLKAAHILEELAATLSREDEPELWATNRLAMGSCFHLMHTMNGNIAYLEEALDCATAARDGADEHGMAELWIKAQHNTALYRHSLAKEQRDAAEMDLALSELKRLAEMLQGADRGRVALNLGAMTAEKGDLFDDFDAYFEAIKVLRAVVDHLSPEDAGMDLSMVLFNIAAIQLSLAKRMGSAHFAAEGLATLDELSAIGEVQDVIARRIDALREELRGIAER